MAVLLRRGNMEEKRVVTDMKNIQIPNNAGFLLDIFEV
jgi:hypothetical protein